jgi:hypothetical protein
MTRKQWLLVGLAVVLAGISLYLNKDWFASKDIHIYHRSLPDRASLIRGRKSARKNDSATDPVFFGFDRKIKLTSIEVFAANEIETNKYAHALWHLISDSNSVPVKDITYGTPIKGMRPALKAATPEELQPGEPYRLVIHTASAEKAAHDFVPNPRTQQ